MTEADRLPAKAPGARGRGPGGHPPRGALAARWGLRETTRSPVDFTPAMTGAVVTMSCSIMLLLYFFSTSFVYVMIAIFGLGAGTCLYNCLLPVVRHLPCGTSGSCPAAEPVCSCPCCCWLACAWWCDGPGSPCRSRGPLGVAAGTRWAWPCLSDPRRVSLPTLKELRLLPAGPASLGVFFVFVAVCSQDRREHHGWSGSGPANSLSHERLPMVLKVPG